MNHLFDPHPSKHRDGFTLCIDCGKDRYESIHDPEPIIAALQEENDRLTGVEFIHEGCQQLRVGDVQCVIDQRDHLARCLKESDGRVDQLIVAIDKIDLENRRLEELLNKNLKDYCWRMEQEVGAKWKYRQMVENVEYMCERWAGLTDDSYMTSYRSIQEYIIKSMNDPNFIKICEAGRNLARD